MRITAVAIRLFDAAVALARHLPAARRADLQLAFADRVRAVEHDEGPLAVVGVTIAEISDVLWVSSRARFAPMAIRSGQRSPEPPSSARSWTLGVDVRHATRRLLARRSGAALVVGLLTLGVSTSAVVFGLTDALLVRPAPFADVSHLLQINSSASNTRILMTSMPAELAGRWLARTDLFSSVGVYTGTSGLVTDHGDPEIIPAAFLSPGLLETLGVPPARGRTFRPDEGRPGSDHVVIISDDVWSARFGRAADVVGQTLRLNGSDYEVVGVMPPSFQFPFSIQRLWMPLSLSTTLATDKARFLTVVARLRPSISREVLRAQVAAAAPVIRAQASTEWDYGAVAQFFDEPRATDSARRSIQLLAAATLLLVLMVCLTVANLGLARVLVRSRDMAVRSALGASRVRLIRQAIVEDLIVGAASLLAAWPLTVLGLRAARAWMPAQFTRMTLHIVALDWRLAAVTAVLALAIPVLAGLVPALVGSRSNLLDVLRLDTRSTTGGHASRWIRQGLVVLEVACAVVLLASAVLLGRSFLRLQRADLGFESRNLISANIGFPRTAFPTPVSRDVYLDRVVAQIAQLPGVEGVTPATGVPPQNGLVSFGALRLEGQAKTRDDLILSGYDVTPTFFSTLGIPIVAGRPLTSADDRAHAVISASLAAMLWPGANAVGRRFQWDGAKTWTEVVGVAGTIRETLDAPLVMPQIYLPLVTESAARTAPTWQTSGAIGGYMRIAVRANNPILVIPAMRQILRAAEPSILITAVERVDDELSRDLERPRFLLALMTLFGGAGLTLAAAGVYGVLACLVSQRLREIGVRLMLGADPRRVGREVLASGMATVAVGLLAGLAVAVGASRLVGSLLFEVNAHDPASYATVIAVMALAGVLAAWWPARRAMRADPLALLRND